MMRLLKKLFQKTRREKKAVKHAVGVLVWAACILSADVCLSSVYGAESQTVSGDSIGIVEAGGEGGEEPQIPSGPQETGQTVSGPSVVPVVPLVPVVPEVTPELESVSENAIVLFGAPGSPLETACEELGLSLNGTVISGIIDEKFTGGDLKIPEGVTGIDANVFQGRGSLTAVTLPGTMTSVGDGAFSGCRITRLTVPAGMNLGDSSNAFEGVEVTCLAVTAAGGSDFSVWQSAEKKLTEEWGLNGSKITGAVLIHNGTESDYTKRFTNLQIGDVYMGQNLTAKSDDELWTICFSNGTAVRYGETEYANFFQFLGAVRSFTGSDIHYDDFDNAVKSEYATLWSRMGVVFQGKMRRLLDDMDSLEIKAVPAGEA